LPESASVYDADTLSNREELTGSKCGIFLDKTKRPMNLNVCCSRCTKAEVEMRIVGGEITGLT
jgi:hypothetical protein